MRASGDTSKTENAMMVLDVKLNVSSAFEQTNDFVEHANFPKLSLCSTVRSSTSFG